MKAACSITGCGREQHARTLCDMHSRRVKNTGDPHNRGSRGGRPLKGAHPTWAAIHKRLYRQRGSARAYACIDCGKNAREWSYDGQDPNELIGNSHQWRLAYSLDLSHYFPRCSSCHRLFDKRLADRPGPPAGLQLLITEGISR